MKLSLSTPSSRKTWCDVWCRLNNALRDQVIVQTYRANELKRLRRDITAIHPLEVILRGLHRRADARAAL